MRINIEVICQGLNSINKKTQIKKKRETNKIYTDLYML